MNFIKKAILTIIPALVGFSFGLQKPQEVSADELFSYDEILQPIWSGDTAYNESVLVVEEQDGSIAPINLLYNATEIIKVQSATLVDTYTPDVDYSLENGKLVVNKDGNIPHLTYDEMHPTSVEQLEYQLPVDVYESSAGGYINLHEGMWYHNRQIVVTYKHSDSYQGYIPEGKLNLLPKTKAILENKQELRVLMYGDSITTGANSSGKYAASPFMPIYPELFKKGIEKTYGIPVKMANDSVGGKTSEWGVTNAPNVIKNHQDADFNLIVIAFGMNDGCEANKTASYQNKTMKLLKQSYPNAEFILVGTMLPNPDCIRTQSHHTEQSEALKDFEDEGCVVCDITKVHQSLLERKQFADMTGNDINHCNDYLTRVYATSLLKTLEDGNYVPHKNSVKPSANKKTWLIIALSVGGSLLLCGGIFCTIYFTQKKRKLK